MNAEQPNFEKMTPPELSIHFAKECLAQSKKYRERSLPSNAALCLKHASFWRKKAATQLMALN
jgi:hypothetical protein